MDTAACMHQPPSCSRSTAAVTAVPAAGTSLVITSDPESLIGVVSEDKTVYVVIYPPAN